MKFATIISVAMIMTGCAYNTQMQHGDETIDVMCMGGEPYTYVHIKKGVVTSKKPIKVSDSENPCN